MPVLQHLERLSGLHPDLVRVVHRALELQAGLVVLEGLRTQERQRQLLRAKATTTLNSRHLTGHAVDLGVTVGGELRWDWPLYHHLADTVKAAARDERVPVEWGGDWKSFKDGPHFQLPWGSYPMAGMAGAPPLVS